MPTVEHIHFSPHDLSVKDRMITYSLNSSRAVIEGLPQIFWEDGLPWREANLWAMERVTNGEALLKTVSSNLNGLLNYAKFLESRRLQWFEFPSRKADRCLVQYRGALIKARDAGNTRQRDQLASLLSEADAKILELYDRIAELERQLPASNIISLDTRGPRKL